MSANKTVRTVVDCEPWSRPLLYIDNRLTPGGSYNASSYPGPNAARPRAAASRPSRPRRAFRGIDRYVYKRVRDFLVRRHKVAGRGTRRFSGDVVDGERGLLRLERLPLTAPLCASR